MCYKIAGFRKSRENAQMAEDTKQYNRSTTLLRAIDAHAPPHEIYKILKAGADPNQPDATGRTPMDAARDQQKWRTGEILLSFGAKPPHYEGDPNGRPNTGKTAVADAHRETALTYMCKLAGGYRPFFDLLANGADPNKRNDFRQTPLSIVAGHERPWSYVAVQLVKHGAWIDPDTPDPNEVVDPKTGATRLLAVIMEGQDPAAVRRILEQGADPNKPDNHGLTPLALARELKWPGVEKMLVEHGADTKTEFPDPNQMCGRDNDTPLLTYAATYQCCHTGYIAALIDAGADLDAVDAEGRTVAYWTGVFGNNWLFDELDAAGADLFKTESRHGTTPLHIACLNNSTYIVRRLLEKRPEEISSVSDGGQTLLHHACGRRGSKELIECLIERGANVNARDDHGQTPLCNAAAAGRADLVQCLIEHGADVAKAEPKMHDNDIFFTLGNHHDEGRLEVGKLLLKYGADPNMRADRAINGPSVGDHILYYCFSHRTHELAEELLKAGSDVYGAAATGETAMHHCLHLRQVDGVKLLLKYGFDPLKHFDYTVKWSNGKEDRHEGTALDEARRLVEQFGHDSEYGKMLDIIEDHLKAENRLLEAPAQKQRAQPKSGPAL